MEHEFNPSPTSGSLFAVPDASEGRVVNPHDVFFTPWSPTLSDIHGTVMMLTNGFDKSVYCHGGNCLFEVFEFLSGNVIMGKVKRDHRQEEGGREDHHIYCNVRLVDDLVF